MSLFLAIVVAGVAAYAAYLWARTRTLTAALARAESDRAEALVLNTALESRQRDLAKYEGLVDVEAHAAAVIEQANRRRDQATSEAEQLVAGARSEAERVLQRAAQAADERSKEASATIREARTLERTIKAMENVIEGYGEKYLIPTAGLLDELAADFGHKEAGAKLKAARAAMRAMIKSGTAADCDYVEKERRATAIHFVLDAFNGKADSVLADVSHDNYGTLAQRIEDGAALVNKNGQAFRNARVTPEYLKVRLDELRWAVVAMELRARDREEQRALRERIRDEEKAQREYERAMKEAAREEEALRRAMEKVQRDVDKASSEQKAAYEAQLAELSARLVAAEEKNRRALLMAQQTRAGFVYVISNIGSFGEHVYKIGLTRRLEPMDRVRELGDASVPFEFDVHAMIRNDDAPTLERALHKKFLRAQVNKVNGRKEFFRVQLLDIRREIERMKLDVTWTMTADCREWKETQAIEEAMRKGTLDEATWSAQQLAEHEAAIDDELARPDPEARTVATA
jgi:hypothetical protein